MNFKHYCFVLSWVFEFCVKFAHEIRVNSLVGRDRLRAGSKFLGLGKIVSRKIVNNKLFLCLIKLNLAIRAEKSNLLLNLSHYVWRKSGNGCTLIPFNLLVCPQNKTDVRVIFFQHGSSHLEPENFAKSFLARLDFANIFLQLDGERDERAPEYIFHHAEELILSLSIAIRNHFFVFKRANMCVMVIGHGNRHAYIWWI